MSEHSRLSPSSMDRILNCPGSAVDNPPDTGSAAATEGTLAHLCCEQVLKGEPTEFANDEMKEAVFKYTAYVLDHKAQAAGKESCDMYLEERIESQVVDEFGGTVDTLLVTPTLIHVIDFKYGVMPVNPEDNKQLLSYLALAAEKYPGRTQFLASIVQPRVFGEPRCVEYAVAEVEDFAFEVMMAGAQDTRNAGSHCKWCPLKQGCKELEQRTLEVATKDFDDSWTTQDCFTIMELAEVVAQTAKEAKRHFLKLLMQGEKHEGWYVAQALGNRAWIDPEKAVEAFKKKKMKVGVYQETKLKSPAQIEKFSKAFRPLVAELSHRPERGPVAVPEGSKLEPYRPEDGFDEIVT